MFGTTRVCVSVPPNARLLSLVGICERLLCHLRKEHKGVKESLEYFILSWVDYLFFIVAGKAFCRLLYTPFLSHFPFLMKETLFCFVLEWKGGHSNVLRTGNKKYLQRRCSYKYCSAEGTTAQDHLERCLDTTLSKV